MKEGNGYRAIDTSTLPEDQQEKVSWSNLWPQALPKYLPAGFKFIEDSPLYDEKKTMENTYEANLTKEVIPSNWIALDDIDRYSDISTALTDYFNQQQALFVTGELDVNDDAQWKAYTDGLNALGLEDWVKMRGIEGIAE